MIDVLTIVATLGGGVLLGWWLQGRTSATRKLILRMTWIVLAAPVVAFVIAIVLSSDTLAMLAGVSMMALLAVTVPVGIGVLAGSRLGRSRRASANNIESSAPSQPAKHAPAPQRAPVLSRQQ